MDTLGHIVGDWKNLIWREQGDSFSFSQMSGCAHSIMVICIRFGCVGRMAQLKFPRVQPPRCLALSRLPDASQTAKQVCLGGTPRRQRCASDCDMRPSQRLPEGSPWGKERHMVGEVALAQGPRWYGGTGDL